MASRPAIKGLRAPGHQKLAGEQATLEQIDKAHLELSGLDFAAFEDNPLRVPLVQLLMINAVCQSQRSSQNEICSAEERDAWAKTYARNRIPMAAMGAARTALIDKVNVAKVNKAWQKAVRKAYKQPDQGWLPAVLRWVRDQAPQDCAELRQPLLAKGEPKGDSKATHWWHAICNCFISFCTA